VRFLAIWLLALAVVSTAAFARELRQPALKSQAALVVDQQSGEILLGKNMESKLPIASLTKLMTAIVTLDAELDEVAGAARPELLVELFLRGDRDAIDLQDPIALAKSGA